ncbi:MAG TPA: Hsp20/alpha crystallin family protein [Acetobacteraceae bacterium]|nr:Hsp20/alpha crystallin family protein [Acetobacteraceae bacterium]
MSLRDLVSFGRDRGFMPAIGTDPFLAFQREMNRTFDRFFRGELTGFTQPSAWPSLDVSETDKDVTVAVELPGLDAKDIQISVRDNVLSIRGEKTQEQETQDKALHISERYYGRVERSIALPADVDPATADASLKNGVLTVKLTKKAEGEAAGHRIEVKSIEETKPAETKPAAPKAA